MAHGIKSIFYKNLPPGNHWSRKLNMQGESDQVFYFLKIMSCRKLQLVSLTSGSQLAINVIILRKRASCLPAWNLLRNQWEDKCVFEQDKAERNESTPLPLCIFCIHKHASSPFIASPEVSYQSISSPIAHTGIQKPEMGRHSQNQMLVMLIMQLKMDGNQWATSTL